LHIFRLYFLNLYSRDCNIFSALASTMLVRSRWTDLKETVNRIFSLNGACKLLIDKFWVPFVIKLPPSQKRILADWGLFYPKWAFSFNFISVEFTYWFLRIDAVYHLFNISVRYLSNSVNLFSISLLSVSTLFCWSLI
jgi:hypothetical protein